MVNTKEDEAMSASGRNSDSGRGRGHWAMLLMCVPMLLVVGVLILGGASVILLIPAIACAILMALMMRGMDHDHGRN